MKRYFWFPLFLLLIAAHWRQGDTPSVTITSPVADEILRGQVTVTGTLDVASFASAQLDFAYVANPTNTWFTIQMLSQPAFDETLAVWDTTLITDGDYMLRLRVSFEDGTSQEVTVPVKVQNDTVPTTPTPEPVSTSAEVNGLFPTPFLLAASPTPTDVPAPTPTALPSNPASLKRSEIYASLGRGALVILGLFVLAGIIIRIRRFQT